MARRRLSRPHTQAEREKCREKERVCESGNVKYPEGEGVCSIQNKGSGFSEGNVNDGIYESGPLSYFLASALSAPC